MATGAIVWMAGGGLTGAAEIIGMIELLAAVAPGGGTGFVVVAAEFFGKTERTFV